MSRDCAALLPRVLDRLFPEPSTREQAVQILATYGEGRAHPEADRVHLGILRLAGADLEAIERFTGLACTDFRDLLVQAEYPLSFGKAKLRERDPARYAALEQKERAQYDTWLAGVLGE